MRGHLEAVGIRPGCRAVELRERVRRGRRGPRQRAPTAGTGRCLPVCRTPVRRTAQRARDRPATEPPSGWPPPVKASTTFALQPPVHAGGASSAATSRSNLAPKRQLFGCPWLEHEHVLELVHDIIDLVLPQVDQHDKPRSTWRPMTAAASTTGTTFALARSRANNGSYKASGTPVSLVRPRPARCRRAPVAATGRRGPVLRGHVWVQRRHDQGVRLLVGQRCQVEHLDRPAGLRPATSRRRGPPTADRPRHR